MQHKIQSKSVFLVPFKQNKALKTPQLLTPLSHLYILLFLFNSTLIYTPICHYYYVFF